MSLFKLIPAWVHGVADFGSAFFLIAVALIVGGSAGAVGTGVAVGLTLIVVSLLTDYPLGVVRVIPFVVHSAGDYLGALLLIAAPFVVGFRESDGGLAAVYVAAGVALIAVSLLTNYQDEAATAPAGAAGRTE